ncbi:MAG: Eco57I restriction-modification methylase domain-containing protein [Terriglobia bacterium]
MSLKRYIDETGPDSIASEIGFYTPLATQVFGALLGYPPKQRIINKSGKHGIPDVRLYSKEDGSEWAVVEAKLRDDDIREQKERERIWGEQILEHGYISPETFYVVLCAPRTFYVCNLDGEVLESLHIEGKQLTDPRSGAHFPLTDAEFRDRLSLISYGASLERKQFEAFREGKLKSGHIPLTTETLPQLQSAFSFAIEKLHERCLFRFRELQAEYDEAREKIGKLEKRFEDVGPGAIKKREKLRYRILTLRAQHHLALQVFEQDFQRFKHDQTYAGTQEESAFEDIFCTNTAYVVLSRLIFVRICEDVGLTTRKISNSGIAVWRQFVQNIKGQYQDLLDVAYKDVSHVYSSLFESSVFDWFGQINGVLHAILERILFRLNALSFREMNRDVLGSMYQYFRPRIERRRLGEYYTPVGVVDYILSRTGITADPDIMQKRIVDPACGSFTFGVRAVSRLLEVGSKLSAENRIDLVRTCLRGQDINPFSTFLSHLSLLFALLPTYLEAKKANPNYEIQPMDVVLCNSLTMGMPEAQDVGDSVDDTGEVLVRESPSTFEYIVGNPPFVRNERLPSEDREVLNDRFPKLAVKNTDLSVYFLYAAAKYLVKEGGTIGMVAPLALANAQMAAYLRNFLKDYEIFELVSLEWCAKEMFPGADIVPMLIFLRKKARDAGHAIRLVRGLTTQEELEQCGKHAEVLAGKSSVLPFDEWSALSQSGDWCLDVSHEDLPILDKLRRLPNLGDNLLASYAIKAGNHESFLQAADGRELSGNEVPFLKGQHIAAFQVSREVDEFAALDRVDTAEDASIWSHLDFYRANRGHPDDSGMGRFDYNTPHALSVGTPSDTLCCLVPEVYVTLVAAVVDPLSAVANNSVVVLVPKRYSAFVVSSIINSRISRYYSFLTLRSAILLRRRAHWYPRTLKTLPMPSPSPARMLALHNLGREAARLSDSIPGTPVQFYLGARDQVKEFRKAGFLGLQVAKPDAVVDREDLAAARIEGSQLVVGRQILRAQSLDVLTLVQVALLATEADEFNAEDVENILLPADSGVRIEIATKIRNFESDLRQTQDRVLSILEEIDDIVAEGLGLTPTEHDTIRRRCQDFPLSVTVERPRFAWSADRKRQARRRYLAGERFR